MRLESGKRGPEPYFWNYVCARACHWLADLNLYVAKTAYPNISWRIITSDKHSIVWDGDKIIWDATFLANGTSAESSWISAAEQESSEILEVGKYLFAH